MLKYLLDLFLVTITNISLKFFKRGFVSIKEILFCIFHQWIILPQKCEWKTWKIKEKDITQFMIKKIKAYFEKKKWKAIHQIVTEIFQKKKRVSNIDEIITWITQKKLNLLFWTKKLFLRPCNHINCHCTYLHLIPHHYHYNRR